jgi:sugar O-acyltransferase (sialic acid O-acetyltransferase NeuD family)
VKSIILFGAGQVGEVVYRHLRVQGEYDVLAFTAEPPFVPESATFAGLPVVSFDDLDETFPPDRCDMLVAVGFQDLNGLRRRMYERAKAKGYRLPSLVSRRAGCGDWLDTGDNCLILDNVTIEPGVKVGNNVVLWSGVLVGHHSVIEDHCWVAGNAVLGGSAKLGAQTFVGLGAVVGNEVEIGAKSVLGAGVVLTKCTEPNSVFVQRDTERYRLDSEHFMRISKLR